MRVLLIFKDSVAIERLAIIQLSASLKKEGHEVRLWIMSVNPRKELDDLMKEYSPEVIGYSAMTGEHIALLKFNLELKERHDFITVFGGPHATFCKELIEEEGVDAICIGEGDLVFSDFCNRIERGEAYWETPTFYVNYQGKCYRNPIASLVPELDELEFPDRKLLYDKDPNVAKMGTKYFMAARGCPFKCSYCFNVKYNETYKDKGKVVRCRTPEQVIREIEWVRDRYPLDFVSFIDDLFVLKPRGWLEEFCKIYKARVNLPFSCTVRANVVKEDVIAMLSDAGMHLVWMGVESGDEELANSILARGLSNKQIHEAARIIQRHDVWLITQNLNGLPVDNPFETDLKTLDLNIALRPSMGWSSILYPYPGSPVEGYAKQHGYMDDIPAYMETNKRKSMLKFSSAKESQKIENLHKLFGVIVRFPFLRPYAEFLVSLPLSSLYRVIWYLWYGYCYKVKFTRIKVRRELPYLTGLFFRLLYKT